MIFVFVQDLNHSEIYFLNPNGKRATKPSFFYFLFLFIIYLFNKVGALSLVLQTWWNLDITSSVIIPFSKSSM